MTDIQHSSIEVLVQICWFLTVQAVAYSGSKYTICVFLQIWHYVCNKSYVANLRSISEW